MSESESIICGTHGKTPATFVCRHAARGVACGFHVSVENADDPWPDAWCDWCEETLNAAGEWTDAATAQADIKLLCTHCWEGARDRNRDVPALVRGAAAHLTADEEERLVHHAVHAAEALQGSSGERWGWHDCPRWNYDDEARVMTFAGPGRPTLVADVRMVGSYAKASGTFQWAWALYGHDNPLVEGIHELRAFGEVRGLLLRRWRAVS